LVSGPRIAPRSSCSTGAYTLRVAISVAGVLGRATDALGPKHRVSPPAFWIWRLVRAWSKAPGDTGRACPLPSSRVCGVLRAALACRERGPWPAYGPRTSRRRRRSGSRASRWRSLPGGEISHQSGLPPSSRLRTPGDAIGSGLRLRARVTTRDQATRSGTRLQPWRPNPNPSPNPNPEPNPNPNPEPNRPNMTFGASSGCGDAVCRGRDVMRPP
jgi:hypothetical protein